jgi:hypothetical protein
MEIRSNIYIDLISSISSPSLERICGRFCCLSSEKRAFVLALLAVYHLGDPANSQTRLVNFEVFGRLRQDMLDPGGLVSATDLFCSPGNQDDRIEHQISPIYEYCIQRHRILTSMIRGNSRQRSILSTKLFWRVSLEAFRSPP